MVSESTEVTHGEEKVTNVIPQFLSKAERVDSHVLTIKMLH
jgi:hypothetical protein